MPRRTKTMHRGWKKRAFSLLLAVSLTLGMVPGLTLTFAAAHWADGYLDQLVDWGVMRADQTGAPDTPLTRAEFMAIINRAYGYTKTGPIPFTDVSVGDWFYDDVAIAYTAGYTLGTSATTFHPNQTLNREQAVCILARNMMMEETPGENLAFSDARDVSSWARGLVKTAVDNYIINGYPDGSFGPQDTVSKGQMASLIVQCIGTPLNKEGDYALGDVFGNVTITSSGVTLRDTTVSGDLYVSGGVGLGNVKLENVNVLGRIIVSGTGESQEGDASVVLRNVTANEMLVDNMKDQLVTLRAEGLTNIGQTTVRTPAYLEDNAPDEFGLRKIDMQETGARLTLAGRVKEVVNTAPQSTIQVAKGTVAKLTVDEAAVGSTVQLDRNTEVKELNLDTGTNVTGQGDVDKMNVNASNVTSTMLPDNIYIRPGLEANIDGEVMDSAAAEESSLDPRILSGYPKAGDVAPTSLKAEFAGNKRGTIYWGVSSITDGSITAEDLISPPSYGSTALKNGSVAIPSSNTAVPVQITGLTVGGSYYLSAVLVDARGERSPVKVISFTTPDNTKPAFAQGYPYMSLVTDTLAQATVMATKSCKLYYAVLPQGAQAPTVNDLKSAAVTGNLGYGVMDVVKNTEHTFTVSRQLEEMKNYVAYFWLTDADGANSSNIVAVRFTTKDMTPPEFDPDPYMSGDPTATSVRLTAGLNEAGTIYWVVVAQGARYPLPNGAIGSTDNTTNASGDSVAKLDSMYAKQQVKDGRNSLKKGSVRVASAEAEAAINVTGLTKGTAYDLYYVAQDAAGNFSAVVKMISIHTLDNDPPTVRQSFDPHGGDPVREPLTTSTLSVIFSEDVVSSTGAGNRKSLLTIRTEMGSQDTATVNQAKDDLADFLEKSIWLYQSEQGKRPERVNVWNGNGAAPERPWINYHNARFGTSSKAGEVVIEFPYSETDRDSAHRLASGASYYFEIRAITDNSAAFNPIKDGNNENTSVLNWENMGTAHNIPSFTTVFAQVTLSNPAIGNDRPLFGSSTADKNPLVLDGKQYANMDMTFRMVPGSTEAVDKTNSYDMVLFTNTNLAFDLYCRITKPDNDRLATADEAKEAGITAKNGADANGWFYIGNSESLIRPAGNDPDNWRGASLGRMEGLDDFPVVSDLKQSYEYDFAITVTSISGETERDIWTNNVIFDIYVLAGNPRNLSSLAGELTVNNMNAQTSQSLALGGLVSIGSNPTAGSKFVEVQWTFRDSRLPKFGVGYPSITAYASEADVVVQMDRKGYIYYAIAPYDGIGVRISGDTITGEDVWKVLPQQGQNEMGTDGTITEIYRIKGNDAGPNNTLSVPTPDAIADDTVYPNFKPEPLPLVYPGNFQSLPIKLKDLEPETKYIIYFVLKGEADDTSQVFGYAFETTEPEPPKMQMTTSGGKVNIWTTNDPKITADANYAMFTYAEINSIKLDGNIPIFSSSTKLSTYAEDTTALAGTIYKDYSVLQALTTTFEGGSAEQNGYSVFDVFAKSDIKQQLAALIREGQSGSPIIGPVQITGTDLNSSQQINETDRMRPGEYYYLLAVGHHTSGTTDAFKAIGNVIVPDEEPPVIDTLRTAGTVVADAATGAGRATGEITITFDKPLYGLPSGASATSVYAVLNTSTDTGSATDKKNIMKAISYTDGLTIQGNPNETTAGTTFRFNFKNWLAGSTITFLAGGDRIANASGRSNTSALTLTLRFREVQQGVTKIQQPYFVATWKDRFGKDQTYIEPLNS